jgi:hypothetical protein
MNFLPASKKVNKIYNKTLHICEGFFVYRIFLPIPKSGRKPLRPPKSGHSSLKRRETKSAEQAPRKNREQGTGNRNNELQKTA